MKDLTALNNNVPATTNETSLMQVESSRAVTEVQGAIISAKQFPRDESRARDKMLKACERKGLAEVAAYAYPRGGQQIEGPTIRLLEEAARHWGNLDFGTRELSRDTINGVSKVQSYCIDLETNIRSSIIFDVKHVRFTKNGSSKLTDDRDIYEHIQNHGARRLRACMMKVIPSDVIEEMLEACEKTLKDGSGDVSERIEKMLKAFGSLNVEKEEIEKYLGHKVEATTSAEIVKLNKVYQSIKDGFAPKSQFFGEAEKETQSGSDALNTAAKEASNGQ